MNEPSSARSNGRFRTIYQEAYAHGRSASDLNPIQRRSLRRSRPPAAETIPLLLLWVGITIPTWAQSSPCRITSMTHANGNMILHWTNGAAPYQLQTRTNLMALWENVGSQTSLCCATNTVSGK